MYELISSLPGGYKQGAWQKSQVAFSGWNTGVMDFIYRRVCS
jgi:hypothetical protein